MYKITHNQEGLVLAYTMLVISLITAISIAMSIIVMNEIRLTGSARDATLAYYAAESGIEQGLYTVKLMRVDGISTLDDAIAALQGQTHTGTLSENDAEYTDDASSALSSIVEHRVVQENDFLQVDYYDFNSPLAPSDEVVTVDIQNGTSGNNPDDATWAEVSWTAWDANGELLTSTSAKKVIGPSNLEIDVLTGRGWRQALADVFSPLNPVGYRLRVKPLFGDLTDFALVPRKAGEVLLGADDLPTQIQIKSVGTRNKFKQSLTATIPWKVPLFGLYDYVLYSEGDLLKDIILSSPVYSSGTIQVEAAIPAVEVCNYDTCADCQNLREWDGLECLIPPAGSDWSYCRGAEAGPDAAGDFEPEGACVISEDGSLWGFTLPIPDTVPEGDEYYVSLKAWYTCEDVTSDGTCDNGVIDDRDFSVEISGQASIVPDQLANDKSVTWTEPCTIPESFSVGDPALQEDDPSRTITFAIHPFSWNDYWDVKDIIALDWYQLSTYKIFDDCE